MSRSDMTVREIIEDIKGDFCEMCCKHNEEANDKCERARKRGLSIDDLNAEIEIYQQELIRECKQCPVNRL